MTKAAATTRSIVIEREMPHPPERVWRALTQGALIEEWLMKNNFQPVVGHRFNFRATPMPHWNGIVDCQVLLVEPVERRNSAQDGDDRDGQKRVVLGRRRNRGCLHFSHVLSHSYGHASMAGQEGIEPPTCGFGDRRSAN